MPGFFSSLIPRSTPALLLALLLARPGTAQTAPPRLIPFHKGTKWGYADQNRRLVLPLQYDEAGPFVQELAWVRIGSLYGYIDGGGNPVTPMQFTKAGTFHHDRATVELEGETFQIDGSGKRVTTPSEPEPETEFLTQGDLTRQNGKVGFRFTVGQAVVPPVYDEIQENYNGLLFVRQGAKWGVVNNKGKVVLPLEYDAIKATEANNFAFAIVEQQGRFGYLAEDGKLLVPLKYSAAEPFIASVARVTTPDGRTGYIDSRGREFFD
ncbi:WG repeat-containing protein [Hymenobacter metallicola]|uniref:WG repeat-containing protein n=1 Tax=Hymenobacter metallicola TaxID=2563114 RepID=A0A4Z0QDK9_9BACT|nr:WG repeat-containing protein [Hymenobacter metallicola]TGE27576.1 WG repeat-containing protein [Hymenobacter metallicola]